MLHRIDFVRLSIVDITICGHRLDRTWVVDRFYIEVHIGWCAWSSTRERVSLMLHGVIHGVYVLIHYGVVGRRNV